MITRKTEKLVVAALCLALGIIVPQMMHVIPVTNTGAVFLPMHIPILLCGYFVGGSYGALVGFLCPIFSFIFTGMPNAVRLPFMICEVMFYGLASGIAYQRLEKLPQTVRIYGTLIIAMISGRMAYFFSLVVGIYLLGMEELSLSAVTTAIVLGIPGIFLQLILVPAIVFAVDKMLKNRKEA